MTRIIKGYNKEYKILEENDQYLVKIGKTIHIFIELKNLIEFLKEVDERRMERQNRITSLKKLVTA